MNHFIALSSEEFKILTHTPIWVGLLIAEADGDADHKELEWIEKIAKFRMKTAHHTLRDYYAGVYEQTHTFLKLYHSELPKAQDEKMNFISSKISQAKPVLEKLDSAMSDRLLESYHSMAHSIAEISGGLLNFFATNPDEEKWLSLEMLS
jgi:hypothetical protein